MHIESITTPEDFARLRGDWDSVYASDPEAEFFLSWTWMAEWLVSLKHMSWVVLAVRPEEGAGPYIGFLPLRVRTREKGKTGRIYSDVMMLGNHAADYTGILARPDRRAAVAASLAAHLRKIGWSSLQLENFTGSDDSLRAFTRHFPTGSFRLTESGRVNVRDNIDNLVCPRAILPDDWESYLAGLGSNTRQKIRRFLRQVEDSDEFRITVATDETVEDDLKALLRMWATKWAPRKGDRTAGLVRVNYSLLLRCHKAGALFLPVLWQGDRPLGALATYVDPVKKAFLFHMAGRDESWKTPPPGLVLHGFSIRHAIASGIRTYDFMRGNEPYKYAFGVEERIIRCPTLSRPNRSGTANRLHPVSVPFAMLRAVRLYRAGDYAKAENRFRQILEAEPDHAEAAFGLARAATGRGEHRTAAETLRKLVARRPSAYRAWFALGEALQALGRHSEAVDAFGEAVRGRPDSVLAQSRYAAALAASGRAAETRAIADAVLEGAQVNGTERPAPQSLLKVPEPPEANFRPDRRRTATAVTAPPG